MRSGMAWSLALVALALVYGLFAGTASVTEAVTGGAAVIVAIAFTRLFVATSSRTLELRAPWLRLAGRSLRSIARGTGKVAVVLVHVILRRGESPAGQFESQSFVHGDASPGSAGRRALATLAVSLSPNEFVVRLPEDADVLLLHGLAAVEKQSDREWPV